MRSKGLLEAGYFLGPIRPNLRQAVLYRKVSVNAPFFWPEEIGSYEKRLVSLTTLQAMSRSRTRSRQLPRFIFMSEFCGSTLLARALGETGLAQVFAETGAFSGLAELKLGGGLSTAQLQLWRSVLSQARATAFPAGQREGIPVFKEPAIDNPLIPELLGTRAASRAVFLYSSLESFLLSVLPSAYRRELILGRLHRCLPAYLHAAGMRKPGLAPAAQHEWFALHWALQIRILARLLHDPAFRQRILPVSTEQLLNNPGQVLNGVCRHLGIPASRERIRRITGGRTFSTHAKSPARAYGAKARRAELRKSAQRYAPEARAGMQWARALPLARLPASIDARYLWETLYLA